MFLCLWFMVVKDGFVIVLSSEEGGVFFFLGVRKVFRRTG